MKSLYLKANGFLVAAFIADGILAYCKATAPTWAYYLVATILVATCVALIKYGNELCFEGRVNQLPTAITHGRVYLMLTIPITVLAYAIAITPGSPNF